jgi:hypothetical protein
MLLSAQSIAETPYSIRDNSHSWYPLTRAKWKMKKIQYPSGVTKQILKSGLDVKRVILTITKDRFGFHLGCNWHGGKLTIVAHKNLHVDSMNSTQRGCGEILEESDDQISKLLSELSFFSSSGSDELPKLRLQSKNGTRLYFRGDPIPEIKYGEYKIRLIELKHRKEGSCDKRGCIEWREAFFDNQAKITRKTNWQYKLPEVRGFKTEVNRWATIIVREFKNQGSPIWYMENQASAANLTFAEEQNKESSHTIDTILSLIKEHQINDLKEQR